jgi:hypothetical protein
MRIVRTYIIPSFVLLAILVVWDFTKPRYPVNFHEPPLQVDTSTLPNQGVPPWNVHEDLFKDTRVSRRRAAEDALDTAWSVFCSPAGQDKLVGALSGYFVTRHQEKASYEKRWGKEGRDYIAREWATPDDRRIERLVAETYARGYLDMSRFKPSIAAIVTPFLTEQRMRTAPCEP